jgi:hypothetical protein
MLAKVQYPGPQGESLQFDAEVPDPPPALFTFRHPEDGRPLECVLVKVERFGLSPGGVDAG